MKFQVQLTLTTTVEANSVEDAAIKADDLQEIMCGLNGTKAASDFFENTPCTVKIVDQVTDEG